MFGAMISVYLVGGRVFRQFTKTIACTMNGSLATGPRKRRARMAEPKPPCKIVRKSLGRYWLVRDGHVLEATVNDRAYIVRCKQAYSGEWLAGYQTAKKESEK